ncbi:MAG: RagB/SusD family nutrient uptake outer membrane protein [Flavobacteriaceae bacterium]|nr:MAG: RagB/SusD family nutrient uptake outer membrane protein [Flavobacteriaceae bacterium]
MKKFNSIKKLHSFFLYSISVALLFSCTDLEIKETDSRLSSGFTGVADVNAALDNAYNSLNGKIGDQANLFALSEVTTDAALIPTRGTDWGDNGIWRQLHQHNWTSQHQYILNVWNQWNETQLQGSQILDSRSNANAQQMGHASFLRALGMFIILDNFGQVPFRDTTAPSSQNPQVLTGSAAVDFIVSDLESAITNLSAEVPGAGNSRANKAAARYLLAKVLLNKHVYTGAAVNTTDMNRVISLVNEIASEGYALVSGYFDIFREQLDNETIWFIPTSVGNRIWNGLHYNSAPEITGGGWNGFSTLAEFYDLFEGDPNSNVQGGSQEERRGFVPNAGLPLASVPGGTDSNSDGFADGSNIGFGFLIGQQYNYDGTPLTDRPGAPLVFTREFLDNSGNASLINNNERTGIRVMKYNPRYGGFANHEIFFRFSDAHLMKAEATMRSGGDATAMVNQLRTLRGASSLASVTEQDLLNERGRELYAEFWRRNDMIRFGQYTKNWEFKDPAAVGDTNKNVFPIPDSQLILNPNLTQNPGY